MFSQLLFYLGPRHSCTSGDLASTYSFLGLPKQGKFATDPVRRSFLIMRVMPERLTTKPSPFKVFNIGLRYGRAEFEISHS